MRVTCTIPMSCFGVLHEIFVVLHGDVAFAGGASEADKRRILPRFDGSNAWEAYITHHVNSKRVARFVPGLETEQIVDRFEWHEVGADHQFHAATYEMLAREAPREMAPPIRGMITLTRGQKPG